MVHIVVDLPFSLDMHLPDSASFVTEAQCDVKFSPASSHFDTSNISSLIQRLCFVIIKFIFLTGCALHFITCSQRISMITERFKVIKVIKTA